MSPSLLSTISSNGFPASMDSVRLSLETSSAHWFRYVLFSGFAVAIGCALELPEAVSLIRRWYLEKFKNERVEEDPKSWLVPLSAVGLLIVILGVAAETVFETLVSNADAAIRTHESEVLSRAEAEAGSANERAGVALEAQEKLKNENLKLQESIAVGGHRSLRIAASGNLLLAGTKPFAGQKFEIAVCPIWARDFEVMELQMNIGSHLKDGAGWVQEDDRIIHTCSAGITVLVSAAAPESTKRAANALTKSLDRVLGKYAIGDKSAGQVGELILRLDTSPEFAPSAPDIVLVSIGAHP